MAETPGRTLVTSVLFLDIIGYSKKSVAEQMSIKQVFNDQLANSLKPIPTAERVILDTGDGAAVTFLGNPEDALFAGIILQQSNELPVRMGINLGPVRVVKDLNGQTNILGDGINVGQRVMSFADPGQLLVSRSFYEVVSRLSDEYDGLFTHVGERKDKHVRAHEVYSVNLGAEQLPDFVEATWGPEWAAMVGLRTRAAERAEAEASDTPAQVFDTGTHLMVSGYSQIAVLNMLEELAADGLKVTSPVQKVGAKWMASCERPAAPDSGCKVEEMGFMRIVTGPTREAVEDKVNELIDRGARLVHDLQEAGGVWTAVCEMNPQ
jgi:Adenylate and Guanylate cyclase catalytic domain